jgi:small subunit ribosomal protein S8
MTHVTDPIGDLLTRMRNAQAVRRSSCTAPWSRIKQELCELLVREEWLEAVEVLGEEPKRTIRVTFRSDKKLELRRVSRPGRRVYSSAAALRPVQRGYGHAILTTSQGLVTDVAARERKLGGEVLCTVA